MSRTPPVTSCEGCGACCRNQPYPPFLWLDGERPPDPLRMELESSIFLGARADSEPCLWLGTDGRCLHYEHRPEICRDFELGGEDCLHVRDMYQIGARP